MLDKKQYLLDKENPPKAILIGLILPHQNEKQVTEYLDELAMLAHTAGADTKKHFIQRMEAPHLATYIGSGKLEEINQYIKNENIEVAFFDDDLTGSQINNVQEIIKIRVVDRSSLILDIFANHAKTAQARTQVELAQYKYLLPRLKGFWKHLERQGGGIGTRGPGETELETDRRIVKEKISFLTQKLKKIEQQSKTQRKLRRQLPNVALVGYTNAGKSALMNVLSKEKLLSENKLFATLDTTTRRIYLEGINFLLSDTVGFIRKLPHHLIESFKSTLEEVREADLLLHVMDIAHPTCEEQYMVVQKTLQDLGIVNVQIINILNKKDLFITNHIDPLTSQEVIDEIMIELKQKWEHQTGQPCIILSATTQDNINELKLILHQYLSNLQR